VAQPVRSTLLLLKEEEENLAIIDRHIADVRELISKQVELVDRDKLKGRNAERSQNLLFTLNHLLTAYHIHRRRLIVTLAE
jgi:uncharacterized damage-inducible protein DinB